MSKIEPVLVYPWGVGSLITKHPHTEPIGIARVDRKRYHVLKVNWHTSLDIGYNECRYLCLSKAEYDTHVAFDSLPVLKVKYKWLTRFQKDKIINFCLVCSYIVGIIYLIIYWNDVR